MQSKEIILGKMLTIIYGIINHYALTCLLVNHPYRINKYFSLERLLYFR